MSTFNNPNSYVTRFPSIAAPHDGCVQRENAGFLAPGQTKLTVSGKVPLTASTQTIPLPTPPPGKIWLLTEVLWSHDDITALEFKLQSGGIDVLRWPVKGDTAPFILQAIETQVDFPAGNVPQLILPADNGKNAYFLIAGVIQNIGNG
jgi:hypothetical protein